MKQDRFVELIQIKFQMFIGVFISGASFLNRWAVVLAEDNSTWISACFRQKSLQMPYHKQRHLVPVSRTTGF